MHGVEVQIEAVDGVAEGRVQARFGVPAGVQVEVSPDRDACAVAVRGDLQGQETRFGDRTCRGGAADGAVGVLLDEGGAQRAGSGMAFLFLVGSPASASRLTPPAIHVNRYMKDFTCICMRESSVGRINA
ncbi:hypothetical protein [Streptomyces sp. Ac-502]|uniref:hypothetical protein n=1 Tax=Streptomyces sp. Ac-502 TaxID=3342801 RepID=UPI003862B1F6